MAKIMNTVAIFLLGQISTGKKIAESFFSEPYSCLGIYRLLPEISKNIIIRGIISSEKGDLPLSFIKKNNDFFLNTKKNEIGEYIAGLTQLKIIEETNDKNYKINEIFFETLKKILSEGLITDKKNFIERLKVMKNI